MLSRLFGRLGLLLGSMLAFLGFGVSSALATVPAEITAMTTDADTVWTAVKVVIVSILGFLILVKIVKLVTRR